MSRNREKREERHKRNKEKDLLHKKTSWESGKLIKPEGGLLEYWEVSYLNELGQRLEATLKAVTEENCIRIFQLYRIKVRDYLLHYPPYLTKTSTYFYLKRAIETYWDNKEELYKVLVYDK